MSKVEHSSTAPDKFKNRAARLTMAVAKAAPIPPTGDYIISDIDNRSLGLCLRIYASGHKTWIARKKVGKRPIRKTLGQFPGTTLEKAIQEAKDVLGEFNKGLDPVAEKRKRTEAATAESNARKLTVRVAFESYQAAKKDVSSVRSVADREAARKRMEVSPIWTKPLVALSGGDLDKEYRRLVSAAKSGSNGGVTQAGATMRWLRASIKHCVATQELVMKDPFGKFNELCQGWAKVNRRTRIIAAVEGQLASWWSAVSALRQKTHVQGRAASTIADYFELSLLFGGRSDELLPLQWKNVDLTDGTVTFVDTKNHRDHVIPYGTYAASVLNRRHSINKAASEPSEFVFPSTRARRDGTHAHLVNVTKTVAEVVKSSGVPFSPHDLRRTFGTLFEELDSVTSLTVQHALNHAPTSVTGRHYIMQRLLRLRELYQTFEDRVLIEAGVKKIEQPKTGVAVRMRKEGDLFIATSPDGTLEATGDSPKAALELLQEMT
jgi:integrase